MLLVHAGVCDFLESHIMISLEQKFRFSCTVIIMYLMTPVTLWVQLFVLIVTSVTLWMWLSVLSDCCDLLGASVFHLITHLIFRVQMIALIHVMTPVTLGIELFVLKACSFIFRHFFWRIWAIGPMDPKNQAIISSILQCPKGSPKPLSEAPGAGFKLSFGCNKLWSN